MHRLFFLICFCFCITAGNAQHPGYELIGNPESFTHAFATATANTRSIRSDFTQTKSLTLLSEKIRSAGKFWFEKKDRLRMEYIQPYPYLMILNGGKIYTKDEGRENKFSANSSKVFQQVNRILLDCVGGTLLGNPDFRSRVFEGKGSFLIELNPVAKNLKELYKYILVVIDSKDYTANTIEMLELSGDQTLIRFQNKVLNAEIPDTIFIIP